MKPGNRSLTTFKKFIRIFYVLKAYVTTTHGSTLAISWQLSRVEGCKGSEWGHMSNVKMSLRSAIRQGCFLRPHTSQFVVKPRCKLNANHAICNFTTFCIYRHRRTKVPPPPPLRPCYNVLNIIMNQSYRFL